MPYVRRLREIDYAEQIHYYMDSGFARAVYPISDLAYETVWVDDERPQDEYGHVSWTPAQGVHVTAEETLNEYPLFPGGTREPAEDVEQIEPATNPLYEPTNRNLHISCSNRSHTAMGGSVFDGTREPLNWGLFSIKDDATHDIAYDPWSPMVQTSWKRNLKEYDVEWDPDIRF